MNLLLAQYYFSRHHKMKFAAILAFCVTTFVVVHCAIDIPKYVKLHATKSDKAIDFKLNNVIDSGPITSEIFILSAKQQIRTHQSPVLQKYAPYVPSRRKNITTAKPVPTPIIEEYTSTQNKVPTEMTQTTEMTTVGSDLAGVSITDGFNDLDTTTMLSTTDSMTPDGITTDFTFPISSTTNKIRTEISTEDLNNIEFSSTAAEETTPTTIFTTEPNIEKEDATTESIIPTENEFDVNEVSEQSTVDSKYSTTECSTTEYSTAEYSTTEYSTTEYYEVNDQSGSTKQDSTESVTLSTHLYSTSDIDSTTMEEILTTPTESASIIISTTTTAPISATTETRETLVEDSAFTPSTTLMQESIFTGEFNFNFETTTAVDELRTSTIDIGNESTGITQDLSTTDALSTHTSADIVTDSPEYNTAPIEYVFPQQNITANITRNNFGRNGKNINFANMLPQPIKYTYDTDVMPTLDDY
ncbi:unnamed protein product [Ceratitis capitata]|uniref:(Mediterranean fruit fly) hypothetical protein n=1 Tax=Ceratitis capitata TaxID=7213 RepID=A0A811UB86_CERCA|nr:unnamed protein product [Ceratitis capitata]